MIWLQSKQYHLRIQQTSLLSPIQSTTLVIPMSGVFFFRLHQHQLEVGLYDITGIISAPDPVLVLTVSIGAEVYSVFKLFGSSTIPIDPLGDVTIGIFVPS